VRFPTGNPPSLCCDAPIWRREATRLGYQRHAFAEILVHLPCCDSGRSRAIHELALSATGHFAMYLDRGHRPILGFLPIRVVLRWLADMVERNKP